MISVRYVTLKMPAFANNVHLRYHCDYEAITSGMDVIENRFHVKIVLYNLNR